MAAAVYGGCDDDGDDDVFFCVCDDIGMLVAVVYGCDDVGMLFMAAVMMMLMARMRVLCCCRLWLRCWYAVYGGCQ